MTPVVNESCTYRTIGGVPLEARLLVPQGDVVPRAAIAYFHPGAWRAGGPALIHELLHFALRGMVVAAFGYRLLPDRHRPPRARKGYALRYDAAESIQDCVADAQAAVCWLRSRPDVDKSRVVAAGYSSGAHLAAATALVPPVESDRMSCRPTALVLYAGVLDLGASALSPLQHVRRKSPPALVLCGEQDSLASQSRLFVEAMKGAGNRCDLAMFAGGHNAFTSQLQNPVLAPSLTRVDEFLASLGYIAPATDLEQRIADLASHVPKRRAKRSPTRSGSEQV